MSREMSKQQIAYIKARYTPGTRIELTQDMVGENIRAGARGTVTGVDDIGSIMMHWDNGRSLSVIPGVDSFSTITLEYEKANPVKQVKPRNHDAR